MQFNEGFIGYEPNTVLQYSGSDSEERYLQNIQKQPSDWYYRTANISYELNSFGHRCKNIEEIDLDNYILFSGCSYVEGIGLELENTFPYVVSNGLGMDYYNLALGGTGIDVMVYNLVQWLNTVKKLPKAVVIIWTFEPRFALVDSNKVDCYVPNNATGNLLNFIVLGDQLTYFNSKKTLNSKMINGCYKGTKIIELEVNEMIRFDLARDLGHYGIISHHRLAKKIIRDLK